MVGIQLIHVLSKGLNPASALLSETAENVAASLQSQLETSKKIVEMTCTMTLMTDLAREANRAYESLSDILLTISSFSTTAVQLEKLSEGIQRLEIAAQSMYMSQSTLQTEASS